MGITTGDTDIASSRDHKYPIIALPPCSELFRLWEALECRDIRKNDFVTVNIENVRVRQLQDKSHFVAYFADAQVSNVDLINRSSPVGKLPIVNRIRLHNFRLEHPRSGIYRFVNAFVNCCDPMYLQFVKALTQIEYVRAC